MPSHINIQVDYDHTEFTPGDTISGKVNWTSVSGADAVAFHHGVGFTNGHVSFPVDSWAKSTRSYTQEGAKRQDAE